MHGAGVHGLCATDKRLSAAGSRSPPRSTRFHVTLYSAGGRPRSLRRRLLITLCHSLSLHVTHQEAVRGRYDAVSAVLIRHGAKVC